MIIIDYQVAENQITKKYIGIGSVDLWNWQEWFQPSEKMDVDEWNVFLQKLLHNENLAYLCHIFSFYVHEVKEHGISVFKEIHGKSISWVVENHLDTFLEFVDHWFEGTVLFIGLNLGDGIESEIVDEIQDDDEKIISVFFRNGDKLTVIQNVDFEGWKQFYIPMGDFPKLKQDLAKVINCFSAD